jgi:multiple sugar transport system substrate-binding protein
MSIGSSAGATHQRPAKGSDGKYPFEVGIATVPQADVNNKKVISQGPSLCMFQSENPQETVATWLFMKYLTTNVEFQAEFSITTGYLPVLKSVAQNEVYAAHLAQADGGDYVTGLSAKVCMDQADYYYTSPAFVGSSDARDAVGLLLQSALVDPNSDTKAVLDKVFNEALISCREGM